MENNITALVTFRPAKSYDLKINDKLMRRGQPYLVVNSDQKTLSGFHVIDEHTDPYELAIWFKQDRLFVPVSCIDENIKIK